jgi:hypothetical protein
MNQPASGFLRICYHNVRSNLFEALLRNSANREQLLHAAKRPAFFAKLNNGFGDAGTDAG